MQIIQYLNKVSITHIILMSLVLHAFVIAQPQQFQIWDESIFLELVRNFLNGEDHTPYQLPGLYFFTGTAILIFGDNWFSWRTPSVIFGMLSLLVFYKILCTFTSERNALFATTILSFDTIFFIHSSLFLRDIPLMFFGLFSFYLYLKKHYYLCGLVLGFSFFIKETGIFYLILISIYHIGITKPRKINSKNLKIIGIFLIITAGTFLIPLWIYDVIFQPIIYDPMFPTIKSADGRDVGLGYPKTKVIESRGYVLQNATGVVTNPIEHLGIYISDGYLTSEVYDIKNWKNRIHTLYPWGWVVPLPPPEQGENLGWVSGKTIDETYDGILHQGEILGIHWKGHSNLSLWVVGFWATLGFIIFSTIKKRTSTNLFLVAGLVSMYLPYFLLSITGRVLYSYYFILTVPFIVLGIVLTLDLIKQEKIRYATKFVLLAAVVGWFVWFFPLQIIS